MIYPVDASKLNKSTEFYSEVILLFQEAESYLKEYPWCKEIYNGWLFTNVGYAACIFLFEIENIQSEEDNLIWIIVGDFPPMYLDTVNIKTTKEVVETYIDLANDWINCVEANKSLDDCYPFDASTDLDLVALFKKKVMQLQKIILSNIDELNYDLVFNIPPDSTSI